MYQYKTYGDLPDVEPEICAQVYLDLDYRSQWDSFVKGVFSCDFIYLTILLYTFAFHIFYISLNSDEFINDILFTSDDDEEFSGF